jgi:hypothetical protein
LYRVIRLLAAVPNVAGELFAPRDADFRFDDGVIGIDDFQSE